MIPQEPVYPDSGNYGDAFDDMPWEYLEWRNAATIMSRPRLAKQAMFFEQEKERLALMQEFYGLRGSSLCYESFIRRAKAAFQAKREERKKEAKK